MLYLKQSVAVNIKLGPFLDSTDGDAVEDGLTIDAGDIWISKGFAALANPGQSVTLTAETQGIYSQSLSSADANTVGPLKIWIHVAGALAVWEDYMVLPPAVYDSLVGGTDKLQVDAVEIDSTAQRATDLAEIAQYLIANAPTLTDVVADDSILAKLMATDGDISGFAESSDSLQSIRDAITAAADITYAPDAASTITDGTLVAGTYASLATDDGTYWQIELETDNDTNVDVTCEFNMGGGRVATQVSINAKYTAAAIRACQVYAYNYVNAGWDKLSTPGATTEIRNSTTDNDYIFILSGAHTDTVGTAGEVKIRFYTDGGGADEDDLYLDYVAVVGAVSGGATPASIAVAVHDELDAHLQHIPLFTGSIYYVDGTSGNDGNEGHAPTNAFATIGTALTAAGAGGMVRVFAGTYAEAVTMAADGQELCCEIGTDITGATGVPLTISGGGCKVLGAHLIPDAGQIGCVITGDDNYLELCESHDTGLTGFQYAATAQRNQTVRCIAGEFTSIGFEVLGFDNVFQECLARGNGGTETGFSLTNTAAHRNLFNVCVSLDCATAGWNVVAGADDNMFNLCADSAGCGAKVDSGANNSWRSFAESDLGNWVAPIDGATTAQQALRECLAELTGDQNRTANAFEAKLRDGTTKSHINTITATTRRRT